MNGSDLIVKFFELKKITECYMVTGGGAMFLNDAFGRSKQIKTIYNLHEQGCAMAALGSTKLSNSPAIVVPTTGCGGTNTITGLLDAWQDSNPVIFISGNVKQSECTIVDKLNLRKKGVQEANIIQIVKSITKYSAFPKNINELVNSLNEAFFHATNGRPGPVWIDVPMDVQSLVIEKFNFDSLINDYNLNSQINFDQKDNSILNKYIKESKKPLILAGYGIHLSGQRNEFKNFILKHNLPYVSTYLGIDYFPTKNDNFIGRLGTKGDRAGNFAVNNADLLIVLGSSLNITVTGFQYEHFAKNAKIVIIDIDDQESKKNNIHFDLLINKDLKSFFKNVNLNFGDFKSWKNLCISWKQKWPTFTQNYYNTENGVNMYLVLEMLHSVRKEKTIYVSDAGSAYYVTSQSLKLSEGDCYITSGAQADMGFTIPASIGAAVNSKGLKNVIGITGDGSFQMNIQELAVIKGLELNIKIIVLNNKGYLSIRNTQDRFFDSRYFGTDEGSDLFLPQTKRVANCYKIDYLKISSYKQKDELEKIINSKGPAIIEFDCPKMQELIPASSTKKLKDGSFKSPPLDDMYPFLDEKIINEEKQKLKKI